MRSDRVRLSLFAAASFAVLGVHLPFWPVWLAGRGLTTVQIATVGLVFTWTRGLFAPVWAHFVDRHGRRREWIRALAVGSALAFVPFVALHDYELLLALTFLFCVLHAAVLPLGENTILLASRERGLSYGSIRLWGSLAFIAASWIAGAVIDSGGAAEGAAGGGHSERTYWLELGALTAGALCAFLLPDLRQAAQRAPSRLPIGRLLRQPAIVAAIAGSGLLQAGHTTYYYFSTIHWKAAGHSEFAIGLLWAEGVLAEVLLFAAATRIRRRFDERALVVVAIAAAAVRWSAFAMSTDMAVLAGANWLHGLSFAAAHLATMGFIVRAVPHEQSASAQSLYGMLNAAAHGLILAAITPVFAHWGGVAFWPMIGVALLGGVAATWGMRRAPAQV